MSVEVARGFIGEKQVRRVDESPRDGHSLLFAARQLIGQQILSVPQPDFVDDVIGPLGGDGRRNAAGLKHERDVFPRRQIGEKFVILKDHSHVAAKIGQTGGRQLPQIDAVDDNLPSRRQNLARQGPQQRGLSRTRRADEVDKLPFPHVEIHVAERLDAGGKNFR